MKIAFTGAAGTGKTTLVDILSKDLELPVIKEGVREYLKDRGIQHLRELGPTGTKDMQEYVFNTKRDAESKLESFISDRTSLDNATYAIRWCDREDDLQDWLIDYVDQCLEHAKTYDVIFFIPTGVFELEDDGVRSTKPAYHLGTQFMMEGLLVEAAERHGSDCPTFVYVRSSSIKDRVSEIKRAIKRIQLEKLGG